MSFFKSYFFLFHCLSKKKTEKRKSHFILSRRSHKINSCLLNVRATHTDTCSFIIFRLFIFLPCLWSWRSCDSHDELVSTREPMSDWLWLWMWTEDKERTGEKYSPDTTGAWLILVYPPTHTHTHTQGGITYMTLVLQGGGRKRYSIDTAGAWLILLDHSLSPTWVVTYKHVVMLERTGKLYSIYFGGVWLILLCSPHVCHHFFQKSVLSIWIW